MNASNPSEYCAANIAIKLVFVTNEKTAIIRIIGVNRPNNVNPETNKVLKKNIMAIVAGITGLISPPAFQNNAINEDKNNG